MRTNSYLACHKRAEISAVLRLIMKTLDALDELNSRAVIDSVLSIGSQLHPFEFAASR